MTAIEKPVREKISFTEDEWGEFIEGGVGFRVVFDEIIDHRRWSVVHEVVIEREEDGTFWVGRYQRGATENQWYGWSERWGDDKAILTQVFAHTVTTVVYK